MNDSVFRDDILKELFNISVGRAASILSEIIDKKILLNIPEVKISSTSKEEITTYFPKVLRGTLMVSSISFDEELTGKANLIFPADKMKNFIKLCLHEEFINDCTDTNFTDVDFDIVKEVGNIILNSLIGEIGNLLNLKMNYTLPEVKVFDKIDFTKYMENKQYDYFLMLYITFVVDDTEIEGAVIINLTIGSLNEIINKTKEIEDDLNG